jgi:4a-hydroxytetrahydrobiopterin dehydratase
MTWKEENNKLSATFRFANFTEAFAFMTEVAFAAERLQHHPEWSNVWNTVRINLCTHDDGNVVTQKDHDLAREIDLIVKKYTVA